MHRDLLAQLSNSDTFDLADVEIHISVDYIVDLVSIPVVKCINVSTIEQENIISFRSSKQITIVYFSSSTIAHTLVAIVNSNKEWSHELGPASHILIFSPPLELDFVELFNKFSPTISRVHQHVIGTLQTKYARLPSKTSRNVNSKSHHVKCGYWGHSICIASTSHGKKKGSFKCLSVSKSTC